MLLPVLSSVKVRILDHRKQARHKTKTIVADFITHSLTTSGVLRKEDLVRVPTQRARGGTDGGSTDP